MQTYIYVYIDSAIDILLLIKTLQVAPTRKRQMLSKSETYRIILY